MQNGPLFASRCLLHVASGFLFFRFFKILRITGIYSFFKGVFFQQHELPQQTFKRKQHGLFCRLLFFACLLVFCEDGPSLRPCDPWLACNACFPATLRAGQSSVLLSFEFLWFCFFLPFFFLFLFLRFVQKGKGTLLCPAHPGLAECSALPLDACLTFSCSGDELCSQCLVRGPFRRLRGQARQQ